MSGLSAELAARVSAALGAEAGAFHPVSGGCINDGGRLELAGRGAIFLKSHRAAPPGFFAAEADGLAAIAATGAVRVPEVLAFEDRPGSVSFLALEWLEPGPPQAGWEAAFAEQLAALHAPAGERWGFPTDNVIGATPQINSWESSWVTFFREHRLRTQFERAHRRSPFSVAVRRGFEGLLRRLDELIGLPGERPALLHGDLWGGNRLHLAGGEVALIDPACYLGCREADLAMTEMFGRLPQRFYDAYDAALPLEPGYEERREVYNLYHQLNHLNLFGSGYLAGVERVVKRFGG